MSNCTPCTPANDELPIFCDPYPATDTAKRLLVEDEAFCQKALTSPTTPNQILKTNSSGNIQWGTVNSVLQSGPVDLGNQPLTTTGQITAAGIEIDRTDSINEGGQVTFNRSLDNATGWAIDCFGSTSTPNLRFVTQDNSKVEINSSGNVGIGTATPTEKLHVVGNIRVDGAIFSQTSSGAGTSLIVGNDCSIVDIGYPNVFGLYGIFDENLGGIRLGKTGPLIYGATNNFGVNTPTPAKTLHVNGTVRLQGLPTYANNAAAIAGGLVADDVYKTATGELRIVV